MLKSSEDKDVESIRERCKGRIKGEGQVGWIEERLTSKRRIKSIVLLLLLLKRKGER